MTELETTVAAPFRHGRKDRLSKMELVFYYVQDKRWMSQDQAKKLIDLAAKRGLLIKDGEENIYRCASSLADVAIPLGFRPGDEIFAETEEQDPIEALIDDIAAATGKTRKDLAAEMQEIAGHFDNLLVPEASVILLAKKYDVSTAAYLPALRAAMHEGP
ncbi:DUF2240 family protein [Methanocorpusculum sp. MG]|uniref:DUF2240 family protein n=1 Tax=Methanocorpusculum petauri TaxID=3002863 RepID=A0ABT4IGR8_9EURY|nr:DUF2240 family protein [Methanocorpusculum petauri]MDE2443444.1 DUF2240 family protein [Methanocorpusculum sp.]